MSSKNSKGINFFKKRGEIIVLIGGDDAFNSLRVRVGCQNTITELTIDAPTHEAVIGIDLYFTFSKDGTVVNFYPGGRVEEIPVAN